MLKFTINEMEQQIRITTNECEQHKSKQLMNAIKLLFEQVKKIEGVE